MMSIRIQDLRKTDFTAVLANPRKRLTITHPGKYLETEFMVPHKLSANALANLLHVPANRITAILKGQRCRGGNGTLKLTVTKASLVWNLRVAVLIGRNRLDLLSAPRVSQIERISD